MTPQYRSGTFVSEFYEITNKSDKPVTKTWIHALLDDTDLKAYNEYLESPDFLGHDAKDIAQRKRIASAVKVRPFYERLGKGVRVRMTDLVPQGNKAVMKQARYEYRFCIGPDPKAIEKKGIDYTRWLCERYEIPIDFTDPIERLLEKIVDKFGPNTVILNHRQWVDSGLSKLEQKDIELKLKPGELTARKMQNGILKARPISSAEVEAIRNPRPPQSEEQVKQPGDKKDEVVELDYDTVTRKELMAILDDRGVEYDKKAVKKTLFDLVIDG